MSFVQLLSHFNYTLTTVFNIPDRENTATFLEVTCLPRIFRWFYTKILSKQDFWKITCKCANYNKQQTIYDSVCWNGNLKFPISLCSRGCGNSRLCFLLVLPWNEDNSLWLGDSREFSPSLPTISGSLPKSSQCFLCGRRFLQTWNHTKGWIVRVVSRSPRLVRG